MTNSFSLNDLNNNLIKNAASASNQSLNESLKSNNSNCSKKSSINEHKLLNGLLSKPLNTQNESGSNNNENQQNLLIPTSAKSCTDSANKSNKLNNQRRDEPALTKQSNLLAASTPPFYPFNGNMAKPVSNKDSFLASRIMGNNNSINTMETNMLELILNEIDSCAENKESVERLRQMITQMHIYFNEKLNELQANRNKLISEFDEVSFLYI